jgi:hypothetical protein
MRIYYYKSPSENLVHLAALAKCLGISAELVEVYNSSAFLSAMDDMISRREAGVVWDVASLKEICRPEDLERVAALISNRSISVLLLTSRVDESENQFLQILTNGVVLRSNNGGDVARVTFLNETKGLAGEISSNSYRVRANKAITLTLGLRTKADVIMKLQESPSFVCVSLGKASIFVWSTNTVFDVFRLLTAELEFEHAADQYIPAIIFLRFAFGDRCWNNPHSTAGFVIDDPLLHKRYGFINFPRLLESARRNGYHVTVAFIPWNYWRSRASKAETFRNHSDCFHMCAHGCDHTSRELRSADYQELLHKSFIARKRMERLSDRTGIPSDPLMVCPQEQYSVEALRAFADSRQFLALVCTACMPQDLARPEITGADLLLPAQDLFYGFPVFKRHYAGDMSVFAMSLFLGKPAILVEHHDFFRNGTAGVEGFFRQLSQVRPDIRWGSLLDIVTRAHIKRRIDDRKWELRFFSDLFQLEHQREECVEYRFLRRVPEAIRLDCVRVNGREVPVTREDGFVAFQVAVEGPQTLSVQMGFNPVKPVKHYSPGLKYQASVALRRGLSELRDNILARNRFMLNTSNRIMKFLRRTAG